MANTTLPGVFLKGVAASRPAANAVAAGTVYSATDTGVITQSDGVSTWSTWATISTGMTNPMSTVGAIIQGTTAGAPAALVAGTAGFVLTAAGAGTPVAWAAPAGQTGLLAVQRYAPGADGSWARTTGTLADVDATNAAITFTAPASGNVLLRVSFFYNVSHANRVGMVGLRVGGSDVAGPYQVAYNATTIGYSMIAMEFYLTGLTPTTSYTYKLSFAGDGTATITIYYGPVTGGSNQPFVMTAWSAP